VDEVERPSGVGLRFNENGGAGSYRLCIDALGEGRAVTGRPVASFYLAYTTSVLPNLQIETRNWAVRRVR
jgi:hypothetical protein